MGIELKTFSIGKKNEKFIKVNCSLCGRNNTALCMDCSDFKFVKCRRCGLVYQNPQPVFKDLKKRYKNDYFIYELENDTNFFNLMRLGLNDINFFKYRSFANNRFLDIGCATGLLVKYMKDRGWDSKGLEICRESAEYGIKNRGVNIIINSLPDARLESNYFSVIHFSHVIEHVPDPLSFLREVYRLLVPGGMVIVTTPNIDSLQAVLFRSKWRSAIADHLTLFSRKTLKKILTEAGFKIKKTAVWGGLAKGTVPGFIKKPVDRMAKIFRFGDVVLYQAFK
jgi:2-polyprenyl-3-methyl-5-hydroxy-6-metoxy-1,4-benzoquinol methylase